MNKFYDYVLSNQSAFDSVQNSLEQLIRNAPNARIRTQAEETLRLLKQTTEICEYVKNTEKNV